MAPQDYLLYDGRLPYIVEFPNIRSTVTNLVIGEGTYNSTWTVQDLVNRNPQYFLAKGSAGVKTLHTIVMEPAVDIILVGEDPVLGTVTSIATYVGPRYPLAFGFPFV